MSLIDDIKDNNCSQILAKRNVCGTAVGEKIVNGTQTGQPAILVFVEKKEATSRLIKKFSVDEIVPETIDGIPTDIIETGKIKKQGFRGKVRPIVPGYSCGHGKTTAGTIGGIFYDKDGDIVILTNNHVAACENNAKIGDIIYQPGPSDYRGSRVFKGWSGKISDLPYIGTLKQFERLKKNGNIQDSAIVKVHPSLLERNLINHVYPTINKQLSALSDPTVGMQVHKCGRTTGYTTGKVLGVNGTFTIEYDFGEATFNNCVIMTAMSKGGDSGSLIFDMNMNAVGLLFAGSSKVTIANPINIPVRHYGLKPVAEPREKHISIGSGNWHNFTTDGRISIEYGILLIEENANQHCFIEKMVSGPFSSITCTVNTGTDKGATWGPGIIVQWPNGMLKVNLRHGGSFGGYFNTNQSLGIGKVEPDSEYRLRIRKTNSSYIGEVNSGGAWVKVIEIPNSIFPLNPQAIRIGKTNEIGNASDYGHTGSDKAGPVGTCFFKDLSLS